MSMSVINIGRDFSRYPVGRYLTDGDSNGERFREEMLRPKLAIGNVELHLDDAFGYGSSFLEEVFGGLIRHGFNSVQLSQKIKLVTEEPSLLAEIRGYIADAEKLKGADR